MSDVVERGKAALEGVTDGPWTVERGDHPLYRTVWIGDNITGRVLAPNVYDPNGTDAEFIASARSLVPELIAEVERLRAAARRWEDAPCSCAMTESSMRRCPQHGEDQFRMKEES